MQAADCLAGWGCLNAHTCVLADQQVGETGARGQIALRAPLRLRPLRCYFSAQAPQLLESSVSE